MASLTRSTWFFSWSSELRISQLLTGRFECDVGRERMPSLTCGAIETLDGDGVSVAEPYRERGRDANQSLGRQRHRGVLHERGVDGLTIGELHDPLLAIDVEQGFGSSSAQRHAGTNEALQLGRDWLVCEDLAYELENRFRVGQHRQGSQAPRQILLGRRGNSQRAEAVVSGEIEVFEQRQARRLVQKTNHAFAPAVRSRIFNRTRCRVLLARQELLSGE